MVQAADRGNTFFTDSSIRVAGIFPPMGSLMSPARLTAMSTRPRNSHRRSSGRFHFDRNAYSRNPCKPAPHPSALDRLAASNSNDGKSPPAARRRRRGDRRPGRAGGGFDHLGLRPWPCHLAARPSVFPVPWVSRLFFLHHFHRDFLDLFAEISLRAAK